MLVVRDVPNHYHNGDGYARRRADRVLPVREGEVAGSRSARKFRKVAHRNLAEFVMCSLAFHAAQPRRNMI